MSKVDRKNVIDPNMPAVILDLRGLLLRSLKSGVDKHPIFDEETGERIPTASHGAVNFFDRILLPILSRYAPINIIAVNEGGNDMRRMVYPAYKQKRHEKSISKTEIAQVALLTEHINRVLLYLGATTVMVEQREADDVIAGICKSMPKQWKMVHTVDQDMMQLADDKTNILMFGEPRELMQYSAEVKGEKVAVRIEPELVALFKSLVGDQGDGYGGITGFGIAKWLELRENLSFSELKLLDGAIARNSQGILRDLLTIHPGLASLRLIDNNFRDWQTMYYLARLHPESMWGSVGTKFIKPIWTKRLPNRDKLFHALSLLSVEDYLPKFSHLLPTQTLVTSANADKFLQQFSAGLENTPMVGFDYESYDTLKNPAFNEAQKKGEYVDVLSQKITGASVCYGENLQHSAYITVEHKDSDNVPLSYIGKILHAVQQEPLPLVIQNGGFEISLTEGQISPLAINRPLDTRVAASYYDENLMGEHKDGLKDLSWELLRYVQTTYEEVLQSAGASDMSEMTGEQTLSYGCDDSFVAAHLLVLMRWAIMLENQWEFFIQEHTAPNHLMEKSFRKGVNIEWEVLERHKAADQLIIDEGMKKVRAMLEQHCTEKNSEAVRAFMRSDLPYLQFTLAEKWKKNNETEICSSERMTSLLEEHRLKLEEKSVYRPYVEVFRQYEFKGTPAQLRDITAALGFAESLNKNSGKGITEWLFSLSDVLLSDQQRHFVDLLQAVPAKAFKSKEGAEFEALNKFCYELMQPTMKSDWEGDELNFDSPPQVQELLYCKMGLPVRRRSDKNPGSLRSERGFEGSPATNKNAWNAALAEDCPPGDWRRECLLTIREVKEAETRFELFYTPYPLWKHPVDGCVHAGVKDPGTVTRRPTSLKPNILQVSNGPTREMFIPHAQEHRTGKVVNLFPGKAPEIFIPKLPKRLIMAPDFNGQELRITGSESRDPSLIEAYTGGVPYVDKYGVLRKPIKDVHSLTTVTFLHKYLQREFGPKVIDHLPLLNTGRVSYDWYMKVKKLEDKNIEEFQAMLAKPYDAAAKLLKSTQAARSKMAKPTNFLIVYLGTAQSLAENTSMPEEFCEEIMREVFSEYARLDPWQQESIQFARRNGYVMTAYGTRKHVDEELLSGERWIRGRQERRAVNQKIQGCAADILHIVETDIWETELLERYDSHFIAPVYDELVMDVPLNDDLPALITELAQIMDITPPGHAIPMMAEFSFGTSWAQQYEVGERPCEKQIEEALTNLFLKEVA